MIMEEEKTGARGVTSETRNAATLSDLSSISLSIPDTGRRDDATRVGHEEPRAVAWD